ncbi:MAG: AarF/ABC1/UbiB kinase family protein [Nitrospinota bacterium]|nr:AarF/ABC1/UbiB kinase family protein [Nitrospinota bacterium]MDH5757037.1 AarF/ABC1/UbiB kinase family protein [Nitrospinota bacterium]
MALGKLRKASRYITRYREIFSVLVKYGLADWAHRLDLDFAKEILGRQTSMELMEASTEERVRRALTDLGPTFIKFGQVLSVRPDLVGVPMSEELKKLQSNVRPEPYELIEQTLQKELGAAPETLFQEFGKEPVASASIGQVHQAVLPGGERVAVKVQRRGIREMVETDVEILADLAGLLEDYVDESRYYRPRETVESFARTITREMDYNREARNIMSLFEDFEEDPAVKIPYVREDLTTSRVLIMEWMEGVSFGRIAREPVDGVDTKKLAQKGAEVFLKMIFVNGFYHADPHPGNLMMCEGETVGLLDFGMMGRLSPRMREHIEDMTSAAIEKDSDKLARIITRAGSTPPDLNYSALGSDVADYIAYYGGMPISKLRLFEALNEMVAIIHRHHIVLPVEIMLLIKTLVTLEGSARCLSTEFSLISLVAPYQTKMNVMKYSVGRRMIKLGRFYDEMESFMETAPASLSDILERFRAGSLEIHMEHRGLEHSANRLVFGIITAALFVGSSMLLSSNAPPVIYGYSALGMAGVVLSVLMGLRIMWAITISGRLE